MDGATWDTINVTQVWATLHRAPTWEACIKVDVVTQFGPRVHEHDLKDEEKFSIHKNIL